MEVFGGSYGRRRTSSQDVKNVIKGGQIADSIQKESDKHHLDTEIPNAEAFLDQELQKEKEREKEYQEKKKAPFNFEELSFWEQVKYFFTNLWK